MDYQRIHDVLINRARRENRSKNTGIYDAHHIIPKSLGGTNRAENMVLLTPKEHFLVHRLLYRLQPCRETALAVHVMNSKHKRGSSVYVEVRESVAAHSRKMMTNLHQNPEFIQRRDKNARNVLAKLREDPIWKAAETERSRIRTTARHNDPTYRQKIAEGRSRFYNDREKVAEKAAKRKIPLVATDVVSGVETIYASATDAGLILNIPRTHITRAVKNPTRTAAKMRWRYLDNANAA